MSNVKNDYAKLIEDYRVSSKGPFKAEALYSFFESSVLEYISTLLKDLDNVYTN